MGRGQRRHRPVEHPMAVKRLRGYFYNMKINTITFLSCSTSVRAVRQLAPVLASCGVIILLAGCASGPDSHVVSAPPPAAPERQMITTTTTTTPAAVSVPANVTVATTTPGVSTTIVTEAPPALQTEVVLVQPSPKDVWLAGYWTWRDQRYQWLAGHWEMPPNSRSVWVTPRWEQQRNGYKFTEGYWN